MKKDGGGPSLGRGGSGAGRVRKPIQGKKRFFCGFYPGKDRPCFSCAPCRPVLPADSLLFP